MHIGIYKCIAIHIDFHMHLWKLVSNFNITSNVKSLF